MYGPFTTAAQATAAATDADLFTRTIKYQGWSGPDAYPAPGRIKIVKHIENNFLLLGIPIVL